MSALFVLVVRTGLLWLLRFDFSLAISACQKRVLLKLNRLSSHGRLIASQLHCLEDKPVDGDVHAVFDHNHIAHMQVVVVQRL